MNFLESLIFGLISGLTDILPVSAQAHRTVMLTVFGGGSESPLLRLFVHLATLGALYYCCRNHIIRISRQLKLARIPKRRRKRPVDPGTLMDFRVVRMMLFPLVLGYIFYRKVAPLNGSLSWCALFMLLNAVILFLPMLLPTGNKDSRSMSRLEALMMGAGGAVGVFPGISSVGTMMSVASACGADKTHALNIVMLAQMAVTAVLTVHDILGLAAGIGNISFGGFIGCVLAGAAAFAGVLFGVRVMRALAQRSGFSVFAYYSLALSILTFILYLML